MIFQPDWNCPECHGHPGPLECICVTRQKIEAQNREAAQAELRDLISNPTIKIRRKA